VLGPVIGGYVGVKIGQEWCDWITAIWAGATLVVLLLFMPETYAPVLLKMKAENIRKATGDKRYKTALEFDREKVPFKQHFKHAIALPFLYLICEFSLAMHEMLLSRTCDLLLTPSIVEPIVILFSLYMTVIVSIERGIGLMCIGSITYSLFFFPCSTCESHDRTILPC
jgi:MFS family permease